jgi:peptidoglycan hydrolase CwlO-like protein
MKRRILPIKKIYLFTFILLIVSIIPAQVFGDVKPIEDMEETLSGITEEQKTVLEDLFRLSQKIDMIEREKKKINKDIADLQHQIDTLEEEINEKQRAYDLELDTLKKVLVYYQRGGPATYLEILLSADSLTEFLKSINVIKDISKNVNELLNSLEESKRILLEEKKSLDDKVLELEAKNDELKENLKSHQLVLQKQEKYLQSLNEQREYYEEQLGNLEEMWDNSKKLFADIMDEITRIISEGYFTMEDLNISLGFQEMTGSIKEDRFNELLQKEALLSHTKVRFEENQVIIEVPENHLVLVGDFILEGESSVRYEVEEALFYDFPLEESSIQELFQKGPLILDFHEIAEDMNFDFTVTDVESTMGQLNFSLEIQW